MPRKTLLGQEERSRLCIACHDGYLGRSYENKPLFCAVNPATGQERL